MPPSRDEDLDWLYGRDKRDREAVEPTRVVPPSPAPAKTRPQPAVPRDTRPQPAVPSPTRAQPAVPMPPAGAPPFRPGRPGSGPPAAPRRRRRKGRWLVGVLGLVLVLVVGGLVAAPVYAWSQIDRVDATPAGARPPNQPGTTFLLVGSDSREGLTKAQRKELGTGSTAGQRTDTIMLVSIPPGGRPALISLPRDSYLPIPGNGTNKINAAYAIGGPKLLVQTVEQNTGLRIDGYAEVGFGGFVSVIDALGGIEMCLPSAIRDRDSKLDLPKGCQELSGADALGYVRMRKADARGDLGRVERQRAMLAAVAKRGASPATLLNPVRYWKLCTATGRALRLGDETSFLQTASLGWALYRVSSNAGITMTVPIASAAASTPVGSAVLWEEAKAQKMFADLARGETSRLERYTE